MSGMTFRGIRKDYITVLRGKKRPPWAPIERNIIEVPGMPGGHLSSTKIGVKRISVPVLLQNHNFKDLQKLKEDMADWLFTEKEEELIFDDEQDRVYFAAVTDELDLEEMVKWGHGTIEFICPDPFKYGKEKEEIFKSDVYTITNKGTADADPIIELTAKEPVTFAMVQNESDTEMLEGEEYPKYIMIGRPYDVDENPYRKYERLFYTDANSIVSWNDGTDADIDGGTATGKIIPSGDRFVVESYGTGSSWHGPVIKHSLPETVQDFRLSAFVGFINKASPAMVGRIEIYLLDVLGNAVCKMALKDTSAARAQTYAEMRAGDRDSNDFIISGYGNTPEVWNNFSGRLQIAREGNVWSAWIGVLENGIYVKRRIVSEWIDFNSKHMRPVAQVVIHIGTVGTNTPTHARTGVSSIMLDKINQREGIPYIAETGDVIRFDTKTGDAYINGVPSNHLLDFGGDFFNLVKGENQLVVHPSSFDTRLLYRPKYR